MIRFCFKCGTPSPNWKDQKRAFRSPYCSTDCKVAAVNEKREKRRNDGKCPTCGRKFGKAAQVVKAASNAN